MTNRVVHLELLTPNLGRACAFYSGVLGWESPRMRAADASYQSLDLGAGLGGGVVECRTERPVWLPYVAVESVAATSARAAEFGARVMLAPREGPAGRGSVVTTPEGGDIAFWQAKR